MKNPILSVFICFFLVVAARSDEIHDLARSGDIERIRSILTKNPELVNAADSRSSTPLHFAADGGSTELVAFLVDKGADIMARDVDGDTPLHWAAFAGHIEVAEVLLDKGAPLNDRNNNEQTPFHYAVLRIVPEMVRFLAGKGADINAQDYEKHTGLHGAIFRDTALARLLIELGAGMEIRNNYGRTPLLLVARETGDREMAELLINHGADVNAHDKAGDTPLTLAAWRGFSALVDLFLDAGAILPDNKYKLNEVLSFSAMKTLARLFNRAVEQGGDIKMTNNRGGTLLHTAAFGGSPEIIDTLIQRGLDVNQADRYGWTPLHYAAYKGRIEAVKSFAAKLTDLDTRTLSGKSARNLAGEQNHSEVMEILASQGADTGGQQFPILEGEYLGQVKPGQKPVAFALDIVSSNFGEHGCVMFTPDGKEAYWSSTLEIPDSGYTLGGMLYSRVIDDRWTIPEQPSFVSRDGYDDDVPFVTPDGKRLFFLSRRPLTEAGPIGGEHIWYMDRIGDSWGKPKPVSNEVNTMDHHWQISVSADNTLYFASSSGGGLGMGDVYKSEYVDGKYIAPENLGNIINSELGEGTPYIAPDESYIIFSRFGYADRSKNGLYISFKDDMGNWGVPKFMRTGICPIVSHDGNYFFIIDTFEGMNNVYWMDASVIDALREKYPEK